MKKFKIFSFASSIRGRKSAGAEDYSNYKNWRLIDGNTDSIKVN